MTRPLLALLFGLFASVPALAARVAIVQSDDLPPYTRPVAAFQKALGEPVDVMNLHGRRSEAVVVADRLKHERPAVVLALGAKAAYTARGALPETPTIYVEVLNPERYGIVGNEVTGVAATVSPAQYLSQFQGFFPEVKTIGVLRGPLTTDERMRRLTEAAQTLHLALVVQQVGSARDARRAFYDVAPKVDAVWLHPDREMLTSDVFRVLADEARRRRLPLLVETENMVRAGALFAVVPDPEGTGQQAGEMARKILDGASPAEIPVAEPRETHVVLNLRTVESAEIPFDPLLLDFVDVVVR